MTSKETKLAGGNSNTCVVKMGETVRRAVGPTSAATHRLLDYLQGKGFPGSPRFLGMDEQGREILSFIEGRCEISPNAWSSDEILITAARQLKQLHDITAGYPGDTADAWSYEYPDRGRHEVICHNDYGLYNVVINESRCVGVIDFDLAGPGPRLRDIAYGAYWFAPVSQRAEDMKPFSLADLGDQCRRLRLFCETCGVSLDRALLDMMSEVLHDMADRNAMIAILGEEQTCKLEREGHLEHWAGEAHAFDGYRQAIEAVITE